MWAGTEMESDATGCTVTESCDSSLSQTMDSSTLTVNRKGCRALSLGGSLLAQANPLTVVEFLKAAARATQQRAHLRSRVASLVGARAIRAIGCSGKGRGSRPHECICFDLPPRRLTCRGLTVQGLAHAAHGVRVVGCHALCQPACAQQQLLMRNNLVHKTPGKCSTRVDRFSCKDELTSTRRPNRVGEHHCEHAPGGETHSFVGVCK